MNEEEKNQLELPNLNPMVITILASQTSLDSLEIFLKHMSICPKLCFIIAINLNSKDIYIIHQLIEQTTKVRGEMIAHNARIMGGKIYFFSSQQHVIVEKGALKISKIQERDDPKPPIDLFLTSLAVDKKIKAIVVIFSGNKGEGSLGIRYIREKGGLVIVENANSVKTRKALVTELTDHTLPPRNMSAFIKKYLKVMDGIIYEDYTFGKTREIIDIIHQATGHDFTYYKSSTVIRRIKKRMGINQITNLKFYTTFLKQNSREIKKLLKELLINVTCFFRDAEAFNLLKQELLVHLSECKKNHTIYRVWVPACSTGQEAYSIAILLQECMTELNFTTPIRIFATDVDNDMIRTARAGVYPELIKLDVNEARLKKFFNKEDKFYRVNMTLRKMIIFSKHNLIQDPPFINLDLISCRNLLIYFKPILQKKCIRLFNYSLKEKGLLFLGSSESLGPEVDNFRTFHQRWKIFSNKKKFLTLNPVLDLPPSPRRRFIEDIPKPNQVSQGGKENLPLASYSTDLSSSIIEGILLKDHVSASLIKEEQQMRKDDFMQNIFFNKTLSQTVHELKDTKERLRATINALEISNEELKIGNEELQSTNEELQTTNEEIETSKEELQSLNEELITVNAELENRIDQLTNATDDIHNILLNTEVAIIFLDDKLHIKHFTAKATRLIHLIASDVGRPFNHINSNLHYDKLVEDAKEVLKTQQEKTIEVTHLDGDSFEMHIKPYQMVTNIAGVVITFININIQKELEMKLAILKKKSNNQ